MVKKGKYAWQRSALSGENEILCILQTEATRLQAVSFSWRVSLPLRYAHPFLFITQPFRTDTDKTRLPADQLFWCSHRQPASPLARTYGWSPNRKRCTTASVCVR